MASATWLVTGEKKSRTIKPKRPISHGGLGAIEIGARFDSLRFDDEGDDPASRERATAPATSAPPPRGRGRAACPGGRNRRSACMGNVVLETFEDALLAPEPGRQGNYVTILGRLQVSLP